MKTFISWSGTKSRAVAIALRDWLPLVINVIDPFVSSEDINAGTRWQSEIASELEATSFGIVCVTKDNQHAPWLNFEAGALAKAVDSSRVVPLAIDLKPSDVEIPLGQFQAQPATQTGIVAVLASINATCDAALKEPMLKRAAAKWWPDLEKALADIEQHSGPADTGSPTRTDRELLEEMLGNVRSLASAEPSVGGLGVIPRDHPLLEEVSALVEPYGQPRPIQTHSSLRRIRVRTLSRLPDDVRREVYQRAAKHRVRVDYLVDRHPDDEVSEPSAPGENSVGESTGGGAA